MLPFADRLIVTNAAALCETDYCNQIQDVQIYYTQNLEKTITLAQKI